MNKLRFDGPIVKDVPNAPLMWTVADPSSPFYKFSNGRESLLAMGFTEADLLEAQNV